MVKLYALGLFMAVIQPLAESYSVIREID